MSSANSSADPCPRTARKGNFSGGPLQGKNVKYLVLSYAGIILFLILSVFHGAPYITSFQKVDEYCPSLPSFIILLTVFFLVLSIVLTIYNLENKAPKSVKVGTKVITNYVVPSPVEYAVYQILCLEKGWTIKENHLHNGRFFFEVSSSDVKAFYDNAQIDFNCPLALSRCKEIYLNLLKKEIFA